MTPAEIVALLIRDAKALREAGVTDLELEGMKVRLAPHIEEPPPVENSEPEPAPGSFDDPTMYGLAPGSPVPGFAALRDRRRKETT